MGQYKANNQIITIDKQIGKILKLNLNKLFLREVMLAFSSSISTTNCSLTNLTHESQKFLHPSLVENNADILTPDEKTIFADLIEKLNRYNQKHFLERLIIRIKSLFFTTLYSECRKLKLIFTGILAHKHSFSTLIDMYRLAQEGPEKEVYKEVLELAKKLIINRAPDQCKGYVWEITGKNNVKHYLIGTCHIATKNMTKSPIIHAALKKAKVFISENGDDWFQRMIQNIVNLFLNFKESFKYSVDDELTVSALKDRLKIQELDPDLYQYVLFGLEDLRDYKCLENVLPARRTPDFGPMNKELHKKREEHIKVFSRLSGVAFYEMIDSWQRGDTVMNRYYTNYTDDFCDHRTAKWYEEYIRNKLETSEESICIAVGANHCTGMFGLINMIQRLSGLIVRNVINERLETENEEIIEMPEDKYVPLNEYENLVKNIAKPYFENSWLRHYSRIVPTA